MKRLLAALFIAALCATVVRASEVIVTVDDTNLYQDIEGFGASLTDSSAYLFDRVLTGSERTNLMRSLFSTNGIALNFCRQPIGGSDFRRQEYTYDDMPAGQSDVNLTNFTIAYDTNYILPMLKLAASVNTNLKVIASPWSMPAWMKDSTNLYSGRVRTNYYNSYARYFLRYVQSYSSNGMPIYALTMQNEPLYEPYSYPGGRLDATNAGDLARRIKGLFETNGVAGIKILGYDHNWDHPEYPMALVTNTAFNAYIDGIAFHGYAGDVYAQTLVHNANPGKGIYFTESSGGTWSGTFWNQLKWDTESLIIGATRNWARTVIKWNAALDTNGGPKVVGGCSGCRGLVTINTNTHAITTNVDYYSIGHASKFVRPGARRIASTESPDDGPYTVAFRNPDTSIVVVAINDAGAPRNYTFRWQAQSFSYVLPSNSVATFTWPNAAGATVDVWITTGSKTKLLEKQTNTLSFHPLSISWKGRTWTVRDSEGNPGNNLWAAECVHVDTSGWLRIETRNIASNWYCGQVESDDSPGFGTYRWYTVGQQHLLHTNLVGNLSTYLDLGHELDIQFGYAYEDDGTNFGYNVQPYYMAGHRQAVARTVTNLYQTHEFVWNPRTVAYRSWYGHSAQPSNPSLVFGEWTYEGTDVPGDTNEHIRMNLWMFGALPPSSNQSLLIADFTYQASTGTLLFDDFEDGTLGGLWSRYGSGTVAETGGELRMTPTNSNGASLGERATNMISWASNGLSYIFSANLATVSVATSRGAGGPDVWAYQAFIGGSNGVFDAYAASNATILRAGYDQSANQMTIEFYTKVNQANSWGTSRFVGTIDNVSGFFNGQGLELRFSLVYSNYQVKVLYNGSEVNLTTVSGSSEGLHGLGGALVDGRYVIGTQNNDDGRGTVSWEQIHVRTAGELPSTAVNPDSGGGSGSLVQIGDGDTASTWRNPVGTKYNKLRSQVLYPASDIGAAGTITQLRVRVVSAPDIPLSNYTIRLQLTSSNNLASDTFINSGWTTIYMTNTTIPRSFNDWWEFSFKTNFYYDGSHNLLVDFVVNNTARDNVPEAACTYSVGSGTRGVYAGNNSGDPFTWTNTSGKTYQYSGNNYVDIRLAISNDPPLELGQNLDFEDGPRGYLTNVPGWSVEGSLLSGMIKASPVQHGSNSLKIWRGPGNGNQKLYQFFAAQPTNQYTLTGYIMAESGEPFTGSNAYGALVLEWYGSSGLLRADESGHFTPTNMFNVWEACAITSVPPGNVTSGRLVCALFSCDDQEGSLYFDHLSLTYGSAPPQPGGPPVAKISYVADEFNDNSLSNVWTISWGGGPAADVRETNGYLMVLPGSNAEQSTGCTTPVQWNNTSCWYVFSATLSTVNVLNAKSGNDVIALLGLCSQGDNPWWVTNSIGLYGYYDRDIDQFWWKLVIKKDAPAADGTYRFSCTMPNVSRYLNGANRIRVSLALGLGQYELRFSDTNGLPVPYQQNYGTPREDHNLGSRLDNAYWYVGAQADGTNRGWVSWDRTLVYGTLAPGAAIDAAQQTSRDGSGLITITTRVADANGDYSRLHLQYSANGGANWYDARITNVVSSTYPCAIAVTQDWVNLVRIETTNDSGLALSNTVVLSWDTQGASLDDATFTNMRVRIAVDDGDVSAATATSALFVADNQGPVSASATVTIEEASSYVVGSELNVAWSGFYDAGDGIEGYYYSLTNNGGTKSGSYTIAPLGAVADAKEDATNTVYVWAEDSYGNIGQAAWDTIVVLSGSGDYDADQMPNGWEEDHSLGPTDAGDAILDGDLDGYNNLQEYLFGTDPALLGSCFTFDGYCAGAGGEYIVEWNSVSGREYSLYSCDATDGPYEPVAGWTNLAGTGGFMTYTGSTDSISQKYYRVRARVP